MTVRHAVFTGLAAVHLFLVVCGAMSWNWFTGRGLPAKALRLGRGLAGSDANYGFFAPDVGADLRARFTLVDSDGREWTDELDQGSTLEGRLRLSNLLGLVHEEDLRQEVASSLAGTMLARHPTAERVIVQFEVFDPPPMDDYRDGERAEWELIYEATISRLD